MSEEIVVCYLLPLWTILLEYSSKYRVIAEHWTVHDDKAIRLYLPVQFGQVHEMFWT